MHTTTLQAFVLSSIDYGESDRIVTLFTLEQGRIRGFARGARNSRRRFGAALEPLARIDVQTRIKEGLSTLRQADIITVYPAIRGDLARIAYSLYTAELIDALTPEGHPLPRLFRLFSGWLDHLERETATENSRRFFEINLLNILGYRPSLERCSRCNRSLDANGACFTEQGELKCRECGSSGRKIGALTLRILSSCLKTGTFGRVQFPDENMIEASWILDTALQNHVCRKLKSLEFLKSL